MPTNYASYSLYVPPILPLAPPAPPPPADNPSFDLHFCDSVPVLVVCLVCFCFVSVFLGLVVVDTLNISM